MIGYGVATSAFQIEGAADEDGRGPSTWDEFCTRSGAIKDGRDARVACDSYHRVDDDLALMTDLGVSGYRFSIAWPRVQPTGSGPVNDKGIDWYDRLVDRLLAAGITPFPTLYHWDLPLPLEQAGGWPVRATPERFAEYAAVVADRLGDRVNAWATMNEPWCTAFLGYASGVFAPGVQDPERAFAAAHHQLLGHAFGARAIKQQRPDAKVGIVLNLYPVRLEEGGDPAAADVVDAIQNRLWLDGLFDGTWPEVLPTPAVQQDGDLDLIRGSADWLGVNYYTPFRIGPPRDGEDAVGQGNAAFPGAPPFSFHPRPPLTTMGWEVDGTGLQDVLRRVADRAPGLPLRVTENGAAFPDRPGETDDDRIDYLREHLAVVEKLADQGLPVLDYFAWSLLDNFEWAEGWTQTFGLVALEPGTLNRLPKASFLWYREHIRSRLP